MNYPTVSDIPPNYNYYNQSDLAGLAIFAGMIIYIFLVALVVYAVMAIALMKIAKKAKMGKKAWFAWVPILNIILMLNIAGLSGWWVFFYALAPIPFAGWVATALFTVYVWMRISKVCNKPDYLGLLMIVPMANLVLPLYLAYSQDLK